MEKKKIKIAMLQMTSDIGDVCSNIQKVNNLVDKFLPNDTDVLVLPEVWTVGWSCSDFIESAKFTPTALNFLSEIAQKHSVNIIGGSLIKKIDGHYYNCCPIFDKSGRYIDSYAKIHLYSYYGCDEDKYVTNGSSPIMIELEGVKFGLSICYDIRFPELYRAYAKAGADVLVNCAAWGSKKPIPWEMMTKSRAIENQCYMIALTQSGLIKNDEYNLGESRIIDYKGEELAFINQGEGIVSAELDIDSMLEFRQNSPTIKDIRDSYEVKFLCIK